MLRRYINTAYYYYLLLLLKKSTQFGSNWVLLPLFAQNTPNLCNFGSFVSDENPPDRYTKFREKVPQKAGHIRQLLSCHLSNWWTSILCVPCLFYLVKERFILSKRFSLLVLYIIVFYPLWMLICTIKPFLTYVYHVNVRTAPPPDSTFILV